MEAALLAEVLGEREFSEKLSREARSLKEKFEQFFWLEDLGTYALALDGMKKPCRVRASNAGHCLFAGIVSEERARRVAETLMSADFYSGWGIRTLAVSEARYNPMSYHNGSVWPHDNAVIAKGFARYAISDKVLKIFEGLFDSAVAVGQYRLPELFCGFHRRPMDSPTLYPVACLPQAWASGAVFMLLEACIGLSFEQPDKIIFRRPVLPVFLREVYIKDLMFGNGSIDVILRRHEQDVSVEVTKRTGSINVMVLK
jgi:glycogen debranching enzyme